MRKGRKRNDMTDADLAAGNGVLNRRIFLEAALLTGAGAAGAAGACRPSRTRGHSRSRCRAG